MFLWHSSYCLDSLPASSQISLYRQRNCCLVIHSYLLRAFLQKSGYVVGPSVLLRELSYHGYDMFHRSSRSRNRNRIGTCFCPVQQLPKSLGSTKRKKPEQEDQRVIYIIFDFASHHWEIPITDRICFHFSLAGHSSGKDIGLPEYFLWFHAFHASFD